MSRIYLSPPHVSPLERELLLQAFDSNWIAPVGPDLRAFEADVCSRIGAKSALALCSGTGALHLALLLLGVGPGDEVLVATLTFAASGNVVTYVGATPVFVDCDENWTIDPELVGKALRDGAKRGKLPKAVITVDIFGQCANYEAIAEVCREFDVPIIQDAAEALGALYQGQPAGTQGVLGVFSFNGNKIMTTGGGGMLVSNRADWIDRARHLATQARDPAPHYQHSEIGYNYRLCNLLAAVGRAQFARLDEFVEKRRANFEYYREALGDLPGWSFMPEAPWGRCTRWLTCAVIDPAQARVDREGIRVALEAADIEARPIWKPLHLQPVFAGCRCVGGARAEQIFANGICLPSGSALATNDLERIVATIRDYQQREAAS